MPKPYDAVTKFLFDNFLADWLEFSTRRASGRVEIIDADLATVTADADKVVRVEDSQPWLFHVELQASRDDRLGERLHWYNALLEYKHQLSVHTQLILLRREADSPACQGVFERCFHGESPYRWFRYEVTRIWQLSSKTLSEGSWGLFPLAPLCDDAVGKLEPLIDRMGERIRREVQDRNQQGSLWTATEVLMGLRYEPAVVEPLMQRVMTMEESATYQAIVRRGVNQGVLEGKIQTLREVIEEVAAEKFGTLPPEFNRRLATIQDPELLRKIRRKVSGAETWQAILGSEA